MVVSVARKTNYCIGSLKSKVYGTRRQGQILYTHFPSCTLDSDFFRIKDASSEHKDCRPHVHTLSLPNDEDTRERKWSMSGQPLFMILPFFRCGSSPITYAPREPEITIWHIKVWSVHKWCKNKWIIYTSNFYFSIARHDSRKIRGSIQSQS